MKVKNRLLLIIIALAGAGSLVTAQRRKVEKPVAFPNMNAFQTEATRVQGMGASRTAQANHATKALNRLLVTQPTLIQPADIATAKQLVGYIRERKPKTRMALAINALDSTIGALAAVRQAQQALTNIQKTKQSLKKELSLARKQQKKVRSKLEKEQKEGEPTAAGLTQAELQEAQLNEKILDIQADTLDLASAIGKSVNFLNKKIDHDELDPAKESELKNAMASFQQDMTKLDTLLSQLDPATMAHLKKQPRLKLKALNRAYNVALKQALTFINLVQENCYNEIFEVYKKYPEDQVDQGTIPADAYLRVALKAVLDATQTVLTLTQKYKQLTPNKGTIDKFNLVQANNTQLTQEPVNKVLLP